jgi:hypothetical protein
MRDEREELEIWALEMLLKTKILEECRRGHIGGYESTGKHIDTAYARANWEINQGLITLPFGTTRPDFSKVIKDVFDENSHCIYCHH